MLKRILQAILRSAADRRPVRKVVAFLHEAGCGRLPASVRPDLGEFTDERGNPITLWSGMRDWLKPEWRRMFESPGDGPPRISEAAVRASHRSVVAALRSLAAAGFEPGEMRIAEIGCFDGTRSFALAGLGAGEVTATDIPEYYLNQQEGADLSPEAIESGRRRQRLRFEAAAEACGRVFGWPDLLERVTFLEDDICATRLPGEAFDLVVSWEVLEHVERPADLFRSLAGIMKPGALAWHEYNPFFSLTGGHSLCTLDFLWGHARLSVEDFTRYLREFRPREEAVALRFFTRNLNRMSFADLHRAVAEAGLELLAFIPWHDPCDERLLDREIVAGVQAIHPSVTPADLLARNVRVILRKPG